MSRSQPKPKIIYKNLQELIRNNSSSKSNKNKCNSQRGQLSKQLAEITNHKQIPNSASQRKVKFINVGKAQPQQKVSATQIYANYFNQIDAIYTDLEDFLCQSKERVLREMRNCLKDTFMHKSRTIKQIEEMKQMSEYIKQITQYFTGAEMEVGVGIEKGLEVEKGGLKGTLRTEISQVVVEKVPRFASKTTHTQANDEELNRIGDLSLKNSKVRSNRRCQMINTRKKTVYEQILEERESKGKNNSASGKKLPRS